MCIYDPKVLSERTIQKFKPTRLAIKSLGDYFYFCKSTRQDIYSYSGSGVKWKNIVNKHGKNNIKTLWVSDWYYDPYDIQEIALHFSKENQIVESEMWANIKPENGLDGGHIGRDLTQEEITHRREVLKGRPNPHKGKTHVEIMGEERAAIRSSKFKKTYAKKAEDKPPKPATNPRYRLGKTYEDLFGLDKAMEMKKAKQISILGENNPMYGKTGELNPFFGKHHTEGTIAKRKGKTFEEYHGEERAIELKKLASLNNAGENNPMYGRTGESHPNYGKKWNEERRKAAGAARRGKKQTPRIRLICPYCGVDMDASNAKKHHFDNCKFRFPQITDQD